MKDRFEKKVHKAHKLTLAVKFHQVLINGLEVMQSDNQWTKTNLKDNK